MSIFGAGGGTLDVCAAVTWLYSLSVYTSCLKGPRKGPRKGENRIEWRGSRRIPMVTCSHQRRTKVQTLPWLLMAG